MMTRGGNSTATTLMSAAGLALSAIVIWITISNRTDDRLSVMDSRIAAVNERVAVVNGQVVDHGRRLDRDESWISTLITARMNRGGK